MTTITLTPCQQRECIHYHRHIGPPEDPRHVCKAFPKGIPEEVLSGDNDHTEPIGGDDGITFQADDGAAIVYLRKGKAKKAQGDTVQAPAQDAGATAGTETAKPSQDATDVPADSQTVTEKGYNPNQPRYFWSDYLDESQPATKAMFTWSEGDHPRVPAGQPGAGRFAPKSMEVLPGSFDRLPAEQRVWQGEQHESTGPKPPKLAAGQFGEQVTSQVLTQLKGTPFGSLNVHVNNMPMDVIGDHLAIEVKAGLATNQKGAQAWRATIGEPGKAEKEAIKTMSPEEKRRANEYKEAMIIKRKKSLLKELTAEAGSKVSGKTICCIVSEDLSRADVFMVDGFHLRLNWSQYATEEYYIGTFSRDGAKAPEAPLPNAG